MEMFNVNQYEIVYESEK